MYLHPGIVILKFILSHRVLFLLVSSAIDVATADGTHAPWVRGQTPSSMGESFFPLVPVSRCGVQLECRYVQWLQQMEHTHRGCVETCMLGKTPSTPWRIQCFRSLLYTVS